MPNKIAVIGDKDTVLAFKAVGVEVFDATTPEQAANMLRKLCQGQYAVVLIAENLAEQIPDALARAKTQPYPAVVPIPTTAVSSGFGLQGIKSDVEKAIGVDIIFNKEEK
ncbi:MAG: V-type ATP synthase subunit F [Clostridiales bacterium]|nr:V-type ATP synthase subunit F [Clostridiales bacterium]